MAENGVKSTDLANASILDEVIGNRSGSTVAATMFTLAQQLLGSGPLADAIALDGQAHWRNTLANLNTVTGQTGDNGFVVNDGANNGVYRWSGSAWVKISVLPGALGFQNLDDTSDANKPVSTAQQAALNDKLSGLSGPTDGWVTVDLDQTGKFMRGLSVTGVDYRAESGVAVAEATPGLDLADWLEWDDVTLDSVGRVKRAVGLDGVVYEARNGKLKPVTNTGLLRCAVAFGDSTTFGDELEEDVDPGVFWWGARWSAILGASLGITVENRGINGQTSEQIAARMSALTPRATVTGGAIAASGTTNLTGATIDVFIGGPAWNNRSVDLVADNGQRVRGFLTRSGTSAYAFTRYDAGSAITTAAVDIYCFTGWQDGAKHTLIGFGINDQPLIAAATRTIAQVQAFYRAATTVCRGGFTVWGLLDRGVTEAAGTANGDYIRAMEVWLEAEYGVNFCPVRKYLASQRALDDAQRIEPTYTPTIDDTDAIAVGCTPPSFRSGGVHLSPLGHRLQALRLERHLRNRFNF